MRFRAAAFAISLLVPITGTTQISISAPEKTRTEVSSPMVAVIPLEGMSVPQPNSGLIQLMKTEELSATVCDSVILKSVMANVTFNSKRTKGEITVFVFTYTEPPQDKMAYVTLRVQSDGEILNMATSEFPMRKAVTLKINAEEKKSRSKSKTAKIDPTQLDRILAGENPRIEVTLKVENN